MTIKIGFIGAGNMGGAMIAGLAPDKDIQLFACDPDQTRLENLSRECGLVPLENHLQVATKCDYIFLAVKPGLAKTIVKETTSSMQPDTCLVSIAAGIPIKKLTHWSGDAFPVIRIMPNTPALVGRGVFAVCTDHELVTTEQKSFIVELISRLGKTFVLPEKAFDAFTGLIGSGPAYVLHLMEGMIDAGVLLGISRGESTAMVRELFAGSAEMTIQSEKHITQLKEMVTSPGGTTIAGLKVLEKSSVKASIMEAVEKAALRSKELGQ